MSTKGCLTRLLQREEGPMLQRLECRAVGAIALRPSGAGVACAFGGRSAAPAPSVAAHRAAPAIVAATRQQFASAQRNDHRYAATLAIFFTGVQRKLEKMFGTREALIVWGSAKFSSCCRGVPAVPTTSTYAAALLVQGWEVVLSSR